jgi:hypothetical protein
MPTWCNKVRLTLSGETSSSCKKQLLKPEEVQMTDSFVPNFNSLDKLDFDSTREFSLSGLQKQADILLTVAIDNARNKAATATTLPDVTIVDGNEVGIRVPRRLDDGPVPAKSETRQDGPTDWNPPQPKPTKSGENPNGMPESDSPIPPPVEQNPFDKRWDRDRPRMV